MTTNAALLARRQAAIPQGVSSAHPVLRCARECRTMGCGGQEIYRFCRRNRCGKYRAPAPESNGSRCQADGAIHSRFVPGHAVRELCGTGGETECAGADRRAGKNDFFTTGAEALENAVKIARAATGRAGIITFAGGYHGRTMLTMAMTARCCRIRKNSRQCRRRSTMCRSRTSPSASL